MTCLGSSVVDVVAVALCLKGLEPFRLFVPKEPCASEWK